MDLSQELRDVRVELAALRDGMTRLTKPQEYLTAKQVGDMLNVSVDVLSDWRRDRKGPPFIRSSSRLVRYRRSDIEAWANEHLVE